MRSRSSPSPVRTRSDRCPGVLRPWVADDGGLARVRVPGGRIGVASLAALAEVAEAYGDGRVRVTGRANLQLRRLPLADDALPEEVVAAVEATGLLPSRRHDLARNILVSPQTGLAGGRADLRPVADELDRRLLADDRLADLPGRFLFTLDDGRGDLWDRHRDLGLVALDEARAQLCVGEHRGAVLPMAAAVETLVALAHAFLDRRGSGSTAPWHVAELPAPLALPETPAPGSDVRTEPLAYGAVPGGSHVDARDGLTRDLVRAWAPTTDHVVVTPWHGVLVPTEAPS